MSVGRDLVRLRKQSADTLHGGLARIQNAHPGLRRIVRMRHELVERGKIVAGLNDAGGAWFWLWTEQGPIGLAAHADIQTEYRGPVQPGHRVAFVVLRRKGRKG